MGWAVGYDVGWQRDIGYGVPALCDHPESDEVIDRGLAYVCGGDVYGGEHGCGLFFSSKHLFYVRNEDLPDGEKWSPQLCERCAKGFQLLGTDGEYKEDPPEPFTPKPDTLEWITHKMNCPSWADWRDKHPSFVEEHADKIDPDWKRDEYD